MLKGAGRWIVLLSPFWDGQDWRWTWRTLKVKHVQWHLRRAAPHRRQVWFERDPDVKDPAVINTDETCRCLRLFRGTDEVPRSLFKTQNPNTRRGGAPLNISTRRCYLGPRWYSGSWKSNSPQREVLSFHTLCVDSPDRSICYWDGQAIPSSLPAQWGQF